MADKQPTSRGNESDTRTTVTSGSSAMDIEKEDVRPREPSDGAGEISAEPGDAADKEANLDLGRTATPASGTGDPLERVETRDDGTEYPGGVKLGLITLALCLSVFLMALDNSIIATAIPKITDQFHSLGDVGWYGSAYLLTTAALQLLFGKFYSFFSIKWVYLVAISLFELGSLVCGVAPSSTALILGRAIAGLGSAGIFSGAMVILAHSVPLRSRPAYGGAIASMYGIASVAGPLLGGVFTDKVTWRWCFYINLPIGAVTVVVIGLFFPDPQRAMPASEPLRRRLQRFDPLGSLVFMPAVICLLLALQWGGTTYAWGSGRIVALFVLFGVLIAAFLGVQHWQQDNATVPPRIFRQRSVWSGSFFAFCFGAAFLSSVYFLPIWFQAVKGASAVKSGIMNLPMLIATVILSVVAGGLVTAFGYYTPFMLAGTVLMAVGFGLISTFEPGTRSPVWIGYQVVAGAGAGLGMQQPLMAVQTVLDTRDVPTGTAILIFLQTLGGALFVSIAQNVFANRLVEGVAAHAPGIDPAAVLGTGATAIQGHIPSQYLAGVTLAYNDALARTFVVSAAMASLSIVGSALIEWKSVKGKKVDIAVA